MRLELLWYGQSGDDDSQRSPQVEQRIESSRLRSRTGEYSLSRMARALAVIGLALAVVGVVMILIFGTSPVMAGSCLLYTPPSPGPGESLPVCELTVGIAALALVIVGAIIFFAAFLKDRR